MYSLKDICKIIEELKNCSSTNGKKFILEKNKDNELLKKILYYTYNTDYQYGISKQFFKNYIFDAEDCKSDFNNLFKMLDVLATSNINDDLRKNVRRYLNYYADEEIRELLISILSKDLRANINVKLINSVFKNLIPTHEIMLASKFEGKLKGKVSVSLKLDGVRTSFFIEDGRIICKSRQGKIVKGLKQIENALKVFDLNGYMIDGELIRKNIDNLSSDDNFRLTTKIVNSNSIDKQGLEFVIFDIVPIEEYNNKKSTMKYIDRIKLLDEKIGCGNKYVRQVERFMITDNVEDIYKLLDKVVAEQKEGIMLNYLNSMYEFKRTKQLLKVKKMHTVDLRCLRIDEGDGRNKGKLGAIIVNYKGYEVSVGSGFSDEQRSYYWENPNEIVGKICEIQFFEESKNEKGGLSLRFPIFKWVREKDEESYE